MPVRTATVTAARMILFTTRALSRLIGAKVVGSFNRGARQAKSAKADPAARPRILRSRMPRFGSMAKAWTEVSTPDRTRKAPSMEKLKAQRARKTVQAGSAPRFSVTIAECSKAVAASQGIRLAFSTGSQNHQPPQPSS